MNRVKVLGVGLLLLSAIARGQYLPLERPEGAVDATDQTGAKPIGYQFGNPINRITVFDPMPNLVRGTSPLEVDREFKARNITTVEEWKKVRPAIRKAVTDYFGQFPKSDLPLDPRLEREVDKGDWTYRLVTVQFGAGVRTRIGLMIPKGLPAPAPAVIVMDAWYKTEKMLEKVVGVKAEVPATEPASQPDSQPASASAAPPATQPTGPDLKIEGVYSRTVGAHLVRHGVVIVAVDQWHETFGHSSRLNTVGASVHNLSRVISYLETLPELVNPKQIGVFGHIYGAELAQFATGIEDRIAAVAASNSWMEATQDYNTDYWGPPFWATGYFFAEFNRAKERGQPDMYCSARQADTRPLPFLTQEVMALMAPKPYLGINVGMNPKGGGTPGGIESVRGVYQLYGKPEPIELVAHKLDTNLPPHVRDFTVDFFFRAMCSIYPGKCPPATADRIVADLKSGQPDKQLKAARLASWWRCKPAVAELDKLVDSPDLPLRRAAAKAMERCGAVKELFAHVTHTDPMVRMAVIEAIYIHGADKPTWVALAKDETDPDRWVKEAKWQCLQLNPYE